MKSDLRAARIPAFWLALASTAFTAGPSGAEAGTTVLATTFPIYQIVRNVAEGRGGVRVELLLPSRLGCPHDYALTPQDMRKLAQADVLVVNGLGLEEFLGAPVERANPDITVIDSSAGIKEIVAYAGGSAACHDHAPCRLHAGKPYEWAGAFALQAGIYRWAFLAGGDTHTVPVMKLLVLPSVPDDPIDRAEANACELFRTAGRAVENGERLRAAELQLLHRDAAHKSAEFEVRIDKAGTYVFFTESMPSAVDGGGHVLRTSDGKAIEPVAQKLELGPVPGHAGEAHAHGPECGHGGVNPHLFASPRMTARLAVTIAAELSRIDPGGAAIYARNARAYAGAMNALADELAALGKRLRNNRIVQPHGVFDYLARDMGLEIAAVMQEEGRKPSAAAMVQLVKTIRETHAGAVVTEPQYPDRIGRILAQETGLPLVMLDPGATGPVNVPLTYYETIMRRNMKTLEAALGAR